MNSEKMLWHNGACHCGRVKFQVKAPKCVSLTICNCSLCAMTGFEHLIVPKADFRLLAGADNLSLYTFNTHTAQHTFCKTCGVKPFYRPRSHPDGYSVNFKCVQQGGFEKITRSDFDGQNWEDNVAKLREA